MKGLTLIVSYPKSGNTWFRAFLSSALQRGSEIDINDIGVINAADRHFCGHHLGLNSCEMSELEFARIRPRIYQYLATREPQILKVHDSLLEPLPGAPLPYPEMGIDTVIYIARDPRDVVISFSKHLGVSIDQAITTLAQSDFVLGQPFRSQFPQYLASWSMHVKSWLDAGRYRLRLLRYEDMLADPHNVLSGALDFMGIALTDQELNQAVETASFSNLKKQEALSGFVETPPHTESFFSSGKSNLWMETLTATQRVKIETDHSTVMSLLGYQRIKAGSARDPGHG
jgi:hypothetical protein